ncbi:MULTISPECIES: ABC transporter permease family protein [Streptomyces violaceusniger group]
MAAAIVSACGILLETGPRASVPPQRYAGAPVVIAADQRVHYVIGHGDGRSEESEQVPDRARLDASLVATAARTPGAAAAAPDVTFLLRTAHGALTGHGWGVAPFTGVALASGSAPREGEAVLSPGAARAAGTGVGGRITVTAPDGRHTFRVSGVTRKAGGADGDGLTAWFTDRRARALSGHPATVDAALVRPRTGTGPDRLAVDGLLAKAAHARVGHRLALHLPDGTTISPTVVAIYGRGLGIAELTLPRTALSGHVTSAYDSDVLVRDAEGADRKAVAAALGRRLGEDVTDRDGYAAAQDEERKLNAWANTVMAGVLGGFAAVAAVNTLVMTVLDRRREHHVGYRPGHGDRPGHARADDARPDRRAPVRPAAHLRGRAPPWRWASRRRRSRPARRCAARRRSREP